MKKINLSITGCMGRMGQQLIKSSKINRNFKLVSLTENKIINKKILGIKPGLNNIDSFKKAQKFNPDFVVYTGDYVSYENEKQFEQLDEVLKYTVKGKIGTVGILGNHDYGKNWAEQGVADKISEQLTNVGIEVLKNQQVDLSGLNIIGFDDYWGLNFAPEKVMNSFDQSKANLLLCHNPDVCDLDIWNGYKGWILSGHTHGGQCKPPFLNAPMLPVKNKRYSQGEIDLNDGRTLYVNRAVGHLWQVRFNVRPEITIFELEKA